MEDKDKLTKELKAENEQLKEEIKKLEDFIKSDGEIDYINHEYTYKLKQTLQEIKTIAESCMSKDACFGCKYKDDCRIEDAGIPTYDICKLLIQKITKAEEE